VDQINTLEEIEEIYQSVRDAVELNDQIFGILLQFNLPAREDKASRFIDEVYQLINTLNSCIYETKDTADRRKEQIKKEVLKEVPELNMRIAEITKVLALEKYLLIEGANIKAIQAELSELEVRMRAIIDKKKAIQRYQKTLDMGYTEPFNNAEEARVRLGYLTRLWTSLQVWRQNVEKWEVCPFEQIEVADILDQSTHHAKTALVCERNLYMEVLIQRDSSVPEVQRKESSAVQTLKKLVFDFKETMPIVEALGNPHLQEVHWNEIKETLGAQACRKCGTANKVLDFNIPGMTFRAEANKTKVW
jgi:dynein heavy chain